MEGCLVKVLFSKESEQKATRRVVSKKCEQAGGDLVAEKLVEQLVTDLNPLFLRSQRKFKESQIFFYLTHIVSVTIIIFHVQCFLCNNMCYLLSFCFIYWVLWRFSIDCWHDTM